MTSILLPSLRGASQIFSCQRKQGCDLFLPSNPFSSWNFVAESFRSGCFGMVRLGFECVCVCVCVCVRVCVCVCVCARARI